jgi:hypothetical protein
VRRGLLILLPLLAALLLAVDAIPAAAASDPFAESCPPQALEEGAGASLNDNPAAKKAIVPAGATSLRICRYWGFGNEKGEQTPKTQGRAATLNDQAEVKNKPLLEGLTYEFKELEPAPNGTIHCPADDGTELYAIFFYPRAEPVILEASLSGCHFVSGGAPRARHMNPSLERKFVRLAKGEHVKTAPEKPAVQEKGVAEFGPPRLTLAIARRETTENVEESCVGGKFCDPSTTNLAGCTRKSGKLIDCHFTVLLDAGETCHGSVAVAASKGGLITDTPTSSHKGSCEYLFVPPELRHRLEEEGAHEARGRSKRATGQSPKRI